MQSRKNGLKQVIYFKRALLIDELFHKFEAACYRLEDIECWSARELQVILGYAKWDNFINAIEKAKNACEGAGEKVEDHFADVGKMVELGSGSQRNCITFVILRDPSTLRCVSADFPS